MLAELHIKLSAPWDSVKVFKNGGCLSLAVRSFQNKTKDFTQRNAMFKVSLKNKEP